VLVDVAAVFDVRQVAPFMVRHHQQLSLCGVICGRRVCLYVHCVLSIGKMGVSSRCDFATAQRIRFYRASA